ncbi:PucR family transcriptional regulator ligand-binding domain-containing protein [Gracilibacillus caseinilyticus]|uniref:PucR family transcriptional regulator ligand-binding domain-containing protein n=1 Tax=Gracilibacillus caseinilyticus TaxID=2932256 RepID=A0ABY4EXC3_9BACI|nr:PucR family transcriptional regulator [Gracilibacillus caseinilyticus]UOQ48930.1 PucR family transcriptional regulator ligand-binding domain-containing protein [Gracilibacillus caseinilyticus]
MAITLKQAMKIGGLKKCRIVAGADGMDKMLKYVTIMEVPDIVRWLKGEELMLTSLYPIKDDANAMKQLVKELHEKGTSALGIKPHRFIDEIPPVILDEADHYAFPIIEIPEEVSYLDILSPVMNVIFDDKAIIQEDLEHAYNLLDEIRLNKWGIDKFAEALHHLLKYEIKIDSFVPYLEVPDTAMELAPISTEQIRELEMIQRPIRMHRYNHTLGKEQACMIAPVIMDGKLLGSITSIGIEKGFVEVDLAILDRATTTFSLEIMRKKVAYELEQQYKSDFFRELLFTQIQHEETLLEKGKTYGFDLERNYIFISLQYSQSGKGIHFIADILNQLELISSRLDHDIIVGAMENGVHLLYPSANKTKDRIYLDLETIYRELNKQMHDLYIGVGRAASDISSIRDGYEQAKQAVILGRTLYDAKHIIYYEELGFYRLLAEIKNVTEINKFYEESIGNLIEYDKHHDLELVHSLTTYFQNNESISKTAEKLFIHINTMKYRLQRIKVLTNLDVKKSEDKLILQIGLKIHNFIRNDYRFR